MLWRNSAVTKRLVTKQYDEEWILWRNGAVTKRFVTKQYDEESILWRNDLVTKRPFAYGDTSIVYAVR